jgi:hypothetical protein
MLTAFEANRLSAKTYRLPIQRIPDTWTLSPTFVLAILDD